MTGTDIDTEEPDPVALTQMEQNLIDAFRKTAEAIDRTFAPWNLMTAAMDGKLDERAALIGRLDPESLVAIRNAAHLVSSALLRELDRRSEADAPEVADK